LVLVVVEHFCTIWSNYPLGLNSLGKWGDTIFYQHLIVCLFSRVHGQNSQRRQVMENTVYKIQEQLGLNSIK